MICLVVVSSTNYEMAELLANFKWVLVVIIVKLRKCGFCSQLWHSFPAVPGVESLRLSGMCPFPATALTTEGFCPQFALCVHCDLLTAQLLCLLCGKCQQNRIKSLQTANLSCFSSTTAPVNLHGPRFWFIWKIKFLLLIIWACFSRGIHSERSACAVRLELYRGLYFPS